MRRRKRTLLLQLLTSASLVTLVQCFNLDVRIPVIKTGGAHAESFFGYAVAQHRTAAAGGARGEAMVLVGAPQDENLQPGTTRSGALWKCAWNNDIQVSRAGMEFSFARPLSMHHAITIQAMSEGGVNRPPTDRVGTYIE